MMSPPMEEVMRKMRRALDPVRAMERVDLFSLHCSSKAYLEMRNRLGR